MSLLHSGFSIVTYGLGSKKSLIHDFHAAFLSGERTRYQQSKTSTMVVFVVGFTWLKNVPKIVAYEQLPTYDIKQDPGWLNNALYHFLIDLICQLPRLGLVLVWPWLIVSNLKGIKRRMIDIGKKITFYFLQNVWKCTVFSHLHLKFAKSAIMTQKNIMGICS